MSNDGSATLLETGTHDAGLTSVNILPSQCQKSRDLGDEPHESDVHAKAGCQLDGGVSRHHLSKSERKKRKYDRVVSQRKAKRRLAKINRKANWLKKQEHLESELHPDDANTQDHSVNHINKRDRLKLVKARLRDGLVHGQRICIDLGLESFMSPKECSRLAQQLCRLYGSNRNASCPAHLYLTSLNKDGFLYKECVRKNAGFENYMIDMTEKSHLEIFERDEIIYLSPNSSNVLHDIEMDKVYIIGGLVDESVKKNVTQSRADQAGIRTAKLPVSEYMEKSVSGSYSQILTVNQVFDILLAYLETKDWSVALPCGIPERNGFVVKDK